MPTATPDALIPESELNAPPRSPDVHDGTSPEACMNPCVLPPGFENPATTPMR